MIAADVWDLIGEACIVNGSMAKFAILCKNARDIIYELRWKVLSRNLVHPHTGRPCASEIPHLLKPGVSYIWQTRHIYITKCADDTGMENIEVLTSIGACTFIYSLRDTVVNRSIASPLSYIYHGTVMSLNDLAAICRTILYSLFPSHADQLKKLLAPGI